MDADLKSSWTEVLEFPITSSRMAAKSGGTNETSSPVRKGLTCAGLTCAGLTCQVVGLVADAVAEPPPEPAAAEAPQARN